MKQRYLSIILLVLVILCMAGAVFLKWEKAQQQQNDQLSTSRLSEPLGYYSNPIKSFSGQTYVVTSEEYDVSMEVPVEFEETFKRSTLKSNSVSLLGEGELNPNTGLVDNISRYAFHFEITNKNEIDPQDYEFEYESKIYPNLKNLSIGESYTFSKYTDKEKLELFGENYKDELLDSDIVYTREQDISSWKVFSYNNYYEFQPSIGYVATVETDGELISVLYDTASRQAISYYLETFYSILNSTELK